MIPLGNNKAYLVTKPEHIFYVSGVRCEGFVIISSKKNLLATDQRYFLLAKKAKKSSTQLFDLSGTWPKKLQKILKPYALIFFEEAHLTIAELERFKRLLPKKRWKKGKGLFEKKRMIKTKEELQKLKKAAHLGDLVLKKALPLLRVGVREREIANALRNFSFELGDGVAFDPIVAFGDHGAIPHHHPTDRKLKKNDAVLIDQGVLYQGYHSDMTRCFFIGEGIPAVQKMYDELLIAQRYGVRLVRPGVRVSEIDKQVRRKLGSQERYFTHSLGHGVGLEIHEEPRVSSRSDQVLQEGMVITIEPGIYKPGIGGVRIEDTLIVTRSGYEVITKSSR